MGEHALQVRGEVDVRHPNGSDRETLPENDEYSGEECLFDSVEEKAILGEVWTGEESEAGLVLADLQSHGKKKTWSQIKDVKRQHRADRRRHEARATKQADCRPAEAGHKMWTTWSLAQGVHQSWEAKE